MNQKSKDTSTNNMKSDVLDRKYKLNYILNDNIKILKDIFNNDSTIIYRFFENKSADIKCAIVFVDGMVKYEIINENIVRPIMSYSINDELNLTDKIDTLINKVLIIGDISKSTSLDSLTKNLLYGNTLLLVEGHNEIVILNSKGFPTRNIEEPSSEAVVRGPREGFTETIIMNLALIRKKLSTSDLKFEFKEIGRRSRTKVCVCYIEELVQGKILNELETRLNSIDIDGILDSGYIEEFIKDEPFSPFSTVGSTERPDVVAGKLLEGRIAIICDGTPVVLTIPFIFTEYFQTNEDYYNSFIYSSINRILRILGFFLTTSVPAIYVSLSSYHQEMIPTPLLMGIYNSREGVPFPTVFEALLMLFTFELLREAGVRLPKHIGQAVSIVGALVLGEAAVNASIVSAPMVIVTALTGISSFLLPQMLGGLIITRLVFLLLSSVFGFYGYIFGVMALYIHLACMKSYGMPYLLSAFPTDLKDLQDTAIRMPWWYMNYRTKIIASDSIRKAKTRFTRRK